MTQACEHNNKCVDDALSKAELICRDQNLSFTPIRQKVLKLLWKNGHNAVKAYDLLEMLQKEDSSAKPVTIYRALDFLLENRLIHKLESQNSFIGCNHPTRQHNCAFLICDHCHEVEECCNNGKLIEAINSNIDSKTFHIENITLEIHGTCQNCIQ
ncbi:transcriptional repressor [Rickettsiales bacterium]|nr:transcriptional repressor [Rickettsiales bacterium]